MVTALNVLLLAIVYTLASREFTRRERMRVLLLQQKRLLEAQVRSRTAELSDLSSELQRLQEVEKSRLAPRAARRDGQHPGIGEDGCFLGAQPHFADAPRGRGTSSPAPSGCWDDGVEVKRRIVEDLRPALLDNLGLGAAITWHVEQMSERSGLDCTVLVPEDDSPLPGHIAIALFRVVQEALTNVLRHAKATRASGRASAHRKRSPARDHR
jgi:signal transduction histidine kinase